MSFPIWLVTQMPQHGNTTAAQPVILTRDGKDYIFVEVTEELAADAARFIRQNNLGHFPFFGVLELYTPDDLAEIVQDGKVDFCLSGIAGDPEKYILWEQKIEADVPSSEA